MTLSPQKMTMKHPVQGWCLISLFSSGIMLQISLRIHTATTKKLTYEFAGGGEGEPGEGVNEKVSLSVSQANL